MVFGKQMDDQASFHLPLKDESTSFSLDISSTTSTDTDSSISIGGDEDTLQQHQQTSDLESSYGNLRHRTNNNPHEDDKCNGQMVDSDSEHGLLTRRRRKANESAKQFLVYAFAVLVGVLIVWAIHFLSVPTTIRNSNQAWKEFKQYTLPVVRKAFKKYQSEDGYTILLRGSRVDLLQQALDAFTRCSSVREIQVDYEKGEELPVSLLSHDWPTPVVAVSETLPTSAVFLLSEGIMLSCHEMEKGFQAWRKDPRRLVGFLGYQSLSDDGNIQRVVPGTGSYAFVSDRAVFTHKLYLDHLNSGVHSRHKDCCELSLSSQVSAGFEKTPLIVKANVIDLVDRETPVAQDNGGDRRQVGLCDDLCFPAWLQVYDWNTIPLEHKAILG